MPEILRDETGRFTIEHYYEVFVNVPPRAKCPHGEGPTIPHAQGVRIACPMDRDCWLVKWEFERAPEEAQ
jgi:hypothetical protein